MKTTNETMATPNDASPMELMLATMEMMVAAARTATQQNDAAGLMMALEHLVKSAQTVQAWVEHGNPKAKA